MRELTGTATERVAVARERCLSLLAAVDRYPDWYPGVVQEVDVLERDPGGQPSRARTKLHVMAGPLAKDFDLVMAVDVQRPDTVKLTRVSDSGSEQQFDVTWRLGEDRETRIEVELYANINAPRFLPLGGIGDTIARGFVAAATAELAKGG
jgi:ribosome-associated toxin RatA of RatAB toxin-antitoxin module